MSLFLGKIHFWLFDKIKWFNELERETLAFAESKKIDIDEFIKEANNLFEPMLENKPLEQLIDESNIHGWLQEAINNSEGRLAFYTTKLINLDGENKFELEKIYREKAKRDAKNYLEIQGKVNNAQEAYKAMNDFVLEGMPCDRINEMLEISEEKVSWKRTRCLHKEFWKKANGDVENFYFLRDKWIETFIKEINSDFIYKRDNDLMTIEK
ncbi:MAG: hypothetical protein ACRDD2_02510 [Sarcina sp.]